MHEYPLVKLETWMSVHVRPVHGTMNKAHSTPAAWQLNAGDLCMAVNSVHKLPYLEKAKTCNLSHSESCFL